MKRSLWLCLSVLSASIFDLAAATSFPLQLGSAGQEYGKCATRALDGGLLFGFLFQNTIEFDPSESSAVLGTPPGIDCAIVKYSTAGTLVWARSLSGPATGTGSTVTITPHGITTDTDGNVIIVGYFGITGSATQCTVDFDPGPGTYNLTHTGGWDPFILKLDRDGNFIWARTLGASTPGATDERLWDVATDSTGALYVTGFIQGTYDLDPGAGAAPVTSVGEKDIVLAKYDSAGAYVWGFSIADTGDTATNLKETSVTVDSNGHVFLTGHFNGTADFDPTAGTANLSSTGQADLFIARYAQADGACQLAIRLGTSFNDTAPPGTARIGPDGHLYLTGKFRGTVDLDPSAATFNVTNVGTTDNIWVASYTPDLALRWGFSIASGNGLDGGHRVDFTRDGSGLYVAGWFSGVTDFDGGAGSYTLTSKNNSAGAAADIFLARYESATGAFRWARGVGGTVTDQTELSITAGLAVDEDDCPYVTGQLYGSNITFYDANGPQANSPAWTSLGQNDAYVIKYAPDGSLWQPTELQSWRLSHFATIANSGSAADTYDYDGDGVSNLSEYALGTDPTSTNSVSVPVAQISGGRLQISFLRARSDVTYAVEGSSDLSAWSAISYTPVFAGQMQTVTDAVDLATANPARRFLRLRVTSP